MGLFAKKEPCCICGSTQVKEKLADGWICQNCINNSGGFLSGGEKFKDVPKARVLQCTENHKKNMELLAQFSATRKVKKYLYIDENKRQWIVPNDIKDPIVMSYDDIVSVDVIQNGNSVISGGTASALAGGALFGAAGAIAGAAVGKKSVKEEITSLMIMISTKNPNMRKEYIFLLSNGKVQEGSTTYNFLKLDVQNILSEFKIMMADAEEKKAQNRYGTTSGADEIAKYKKLCDDGVITKEEFEAKKKQLLGI